MRYVDGFVIPIPKKNLSSYLRMARKAEKIFKEYGALVYCESVADDLKMPMGGAPFTRLAKLKKGETVVFSWVVYPSKAHRDRANAKMMKDPRMAEMPEPMPFDMKRVTSGGFKLRIDA